jgi:hypothetical protein
MSPFQKENENQDTIFVSSAGKRLQTTWRQVMKTLLHVFRSGQLEMLLRCIWN